MNKFIHSNLLKLKDKKIPNAELDLKILLRHASKSKKEIILSNIDFKDIDFKYLDTLVEKRLNNEPVSKIIKKKYFWKHEFFVNKDVLDPRPETEIIIEEVLKNIKDSNEPLKILDIGTGTGCLAISLAKELKNSKITAIDVSDKALKVAQRNVNYHKLSNQIELKLIEFHEINNKFDFIVSNPPYIRKSDYKELQLEILKFEPKIALLAGKDGLKFYRLFARNIEKIMKKNSFFIFEIGHDQLVSCQDIFKDSNLILKKISKDIQKIDRTLTFLKI